ncbi:MAG: MmgE/PrpD family protein [Pseudomonadales bacterium]|nr:MmgE/PrpD family protein [Pseudomonadales bacterium]
MTTVRPDLNLTVNLSAYMAEARNRPLPPAVDREAKHRILDSLAAIVSGSTLKPGQMALQYVRSLGGTPESMLMTTNDVSSAANAAMANGMLGHSDETDDFDPASKAHPGCSVIPAAWAMAERDSSTGTELIRAVALGYDLACRMLHAMNADLLRLTHRSAEGVGSTFGATGAAASIAKLDSTQMRYVLSYAGQQASGIWAWVRDEEHIEKAFDFAGMGARNGVTAATMVQAGFTGVSDVLEGEHNLLDAFSTDPHPEALLDGLSLEYSIATTAIKPYTVGYPIQSALDALSTIMSRNNDVTNSDIVKVIVRLPTDGAGVVNDRSMPDVNIRHCIALMVVDGSVSFMSTHDYERMSDPAILEMKSHVEVIPDASLVMAEAPRQAIVEVTTKDGRTLIHHTKYPPGTAQNPLDTDRVTAKALDLMTPVLGKSHSEDLVDKILNIENVLSIRDLRPLLAGR